ncbi:MAG: hypothetical protein WA742_09135 [Candidatus Cybelea sp.]
MADNPKSLASLADDLEHGLTPAEMERVCRYVASKGWQGNLPFMRATLAAIEDAGFAVVPREAAAALRAPTIAAPSPRCERCEKSAAHINHQGGFIPWGNDESVKPHDFVAAPSPSNEVTPEMVAAAKRILFHETEECDEEVLLAIAAALKARKPAPSNEPAVEWVMCAVRDAMREHNFVVERGSDLWNRLRRHIEAALKARKPADDGAGQ